MQTTTKTKKLTALALLSALAYLAMAVARVSIMPAAEYLKYDPKDVIITIGGFIFGPLSSFFMSVVVSFIEMLTVSSTGLIGLVMNVISTCSFACTAAFIYKKKHTMGGAVAGLVSGWLLATAVMMLWNYFVTPIYTGFPRDAVAKMLIPVFMPFNLIKGGLNAAITMLLYKPVRTALLKSNLSPAFNEAAPQPGKVNVGAVLASLFVIVTCVLVILVLQGRL